MCLSLEQCLLQKATVERKEPEGSGVWCQWGTGGRFIPGGFAAGTGASSLVMSKMCWEEKDQLRPACATGLQNIIGKMSGLVDNIWLFEFLI